MSPISSQGELVGIGALGPEVPCPREAPLPVISVYGTSDEIVLKDGGLRQGFLDNLEPSGTRTGDTPIHRADAFDIGLPVLDRVDALAVRNGCAPGPREKRIGQAEHYVWSCPEGADTEFIAHRGGHDWYSVSDGRSTEELIWEFFEQHPLPEWATRP